jgi:hypothetical protein
MLPVTTPPTGALDFGAKSSAALKEKPYQERACGFADSFGKIWRIATFEAQPGLCLFGRRPLKFA